MSIPAAIVLGLVLGWGIEWVIDWFFWRRKTEDFDNRLTAVKVNIGALQLKIQALEDENTLLRGVAATRQTVVPDDLIVIKGIGPIIAGKLHDAGIYTFAELAALTPARLREIVGDVITRLANEEDILSQARTLADGHFPAEN